MYLEKLIDRWLDVALHSVTLTDQLIKESIKAVGEDSILHEDEA